MKKLVVTLIVAAALTTTLTYAEAPATSSTTPSVKPVVEVGNKICPVSGEKVPGPGEKGAMGEAVKYEYNAKLYNLCCNMCIKDFKKDPEKYSKIAEEEVVKKENQIKNSLISK